MSDFGQLRKINKGAGSVTQGTARLRFSTKVIEDMIKDRPALTTFPRRLPVQGGLPITYRGEVVGAIGVSGMKSHEDEQVTQAGIRHFQTLNA